jgi:hypothetical protein
LSPFCISIYKYILSIKKLIILPDIPLGMHLFFMNEYKHTNDALARNLEVSRPWVQSLIRPSLEVSRPWAMYKNQYYY